MLRLRAVRALLVEEVAGLRRPEADQPVGESSAESGPESVAESAPEPEEDPAALETRALARARRRALAVALLCAAAVAVLFVLHDGESPWLVSGRSEETAFTAGVLLVAAYAGFRLAQYLHLRTLARLHRELRDREG